MVEQKFDIHTSKCNFFGAENDKVLDTLGSIHALCCIYLCSLACLWSKMLMFQWAGMRERGEPLPLAFQYLILIIWRPCDLNLVMISSLASKCQDFKPSCLQFHFIYRWKMIIPTLRTCHFEAISKKFNMYWNACGIGSPPFLLHSCPLQHT